MIAHLRYLAYVLRHKWHVFYAGRRLGVPLGRLLMHDWTKFTPAEWGPYVRRFYSGNNSKWEKDSDPQEWKDAWAHHWQHNPHHWEYWTPRNPAQWVFTDRSYTPDEYDTPLPMPSTYVREMVADWYGAGMAQGKPDIAGWYAAHGHRMHLHGETRALVKHLLGEAKRIKLIP